jgi:hypothetical protein
VGDDASATNVINEREKKEKYEKKHSMIHKKKRDGSFFESLSLNIIGEKIKKITKLIRRKFSIKDEKKII